MSSSLFLITNRVMAENVYQVVDFIEYFVEYVPMLFQTVKMSTSLLTFFDIFLICAQVVSNNCNIFGCSHDVVVQYQGAVLEDFQSHFFSGYDTAPLKLFHK